MIQLFKSFYTTNASPAAFSSLPKQVNALRFKLPEFSKKLPSFVAPSPSKLYQLHILASRNNTRAVFCHPNGNTICSVTGGTLGFRKAGRGTPDVAHQIAVKLSELAKVKGFIPSKMDTVLKVNGFGPGREQGVRGLHSAGWNFRAIVDVTPIKHGGARAKKARRL